MTNKDWIHRVIGHAEDIRIPYHLPLSPVSRRKLEDHFATDDVEGTLDLPLRMTGTGSIKPLYASPAKFGPTAPDEFGVVWTTNEIDRGAPIGPCLTEPDLSGYEFPDPAAEHRFDHLGAWCEENGPHFTIVCAGDLWERASFMCGMERLLLWVALEPDFVASLLQRLTGYILQTMSILADRFTFDCIALSDDYGTQRSLVISPDHWRRLLKPRLAEIFAAARSANKRVFLHSCGHVRPIVPDLIEIGLDILHPIQPEAMDIIELKQQFGAQLTFCGGLGTQDLLVNGTPRQIGREVARLKEEMGAGGGYILEPGITIQADVPAENMLALIEAARL